MAKNVQQLKENLDKYGYGDRTTRMQLRHRILQLGKYIQDINYECPFERSDYVVLDIEIKGDIEDKQEESYKNKNKELCKSSYTV